MKIILFLSFFIFPSLSFAQTVNTIPLKEIDVEYLEVITYGKLFGGPRVFMLIDFGQMVENLRRPESRKVKDENGQEIVFNSDMDCLNFMLKYGYELFAKTEKVSSGDSYSSYLMRKIKKNKTDSKIE